VNSRKQHIKKAIALVGFATIASISQSWAQSSTIQNPGFENGFNDWNDVEPSAISSVERSGTKSGKISGSSGRLSQTISVDQNTNYTLTAYVRGSGKVGASIGGVEETKSVSGSSGWTKAEVTFNTGTQSTISIFAAYNGGQGRFDDFSLTKGSTTNPGDGGSSACSGNEELPVSSASDNGSQSGNGPSKAIDNNTGSRWSAQGSGKTLVLDMGEMVTVKEVAVTWYKGSQRTAFFDLQTSINGSSWTTVLAGGTSFGNSGAETYNVNDTEARYVRLVGGGNTSNNWNSVLEIDVKGCSSGGGGDTGGGDTGGGDTGGGSGSLDPSLPPSGNFELIDWNISVPIDNDGNGKADTIKEVPLSNGYTSEFFYTASDGGMVFRVPIGGAKTSTNTSYTRVELREMLRRGDTSFSTKGVGGNNWVFGSAPSSDRAAAGGVDGTLTGTLAVNHVSTTGSDSQVGRVIFAQIHANDDEPIRFYYRKLPGNELGSIYFAHESRNQSNDTYYELIGSRSKSQPNPADGIALGEVFSYEIKVVGNTMTVKLIRDGKPDIVRTVDMSNSGYDVGGQYMYFKAGAYIQDNTGNSDDYAQVTYYALNNSH